MKNILEDEIMRGKTHMIGGAAVALSLMSITGIFEFQTLAVGAAVGAIGGLIPDIDHPNSKIAHKTKFVGTIISRLFKHRGFWHTPFLYAILWGGLRLWLGASLWVNLLFAGVFSHLLLDLLNPTGIPVFFPFTTKKFHLAKIRTGGKIEVIVSVLLLLISFLPFVGALYIV